MANMHNNGKCGWLHKWASEEDAIVKEYYPKNGWEAVAKILTNRSKDGIHKRAQKLGVKYLSYDENFFEIIDTEEKAYWLGFMFTDGFVTSNYRWGIELSAIDIDHLRNFARSLKSNINIKTRYRETTGETCGFLIKNTKMFNDLVDKGVVRNKTSVLSFPTKVPRSLMRHFIRGLIDGDGSFVFSPPYYKELSFVCKSKSFIECLNQLIYEETGSLLNMTVNHRDNLPTLRTSKADVLVDIIDYLYEEATIYMSRKRNKAMEIKGYCLA